MHVSSEIQAWTSEEKRSLMILCWHNKNSASYYFNEITTRKSFSYRFSIFDPEIFTIFVVEILQFLSKIDDYMNKNHFPQILQIFWKEILISYRKLIYIATRKSFSKPLQIFEISIFDPEIFTIFGVEILQFLSKINDKKCENHFSQILQIFLKR